MIAIANEIQYHLAVFPRNNGSSIVNVRTGVDNSNYNGATAYFKTVNFYSSMPLPAPPPAPRNGTAPHTLGTTTLRETQRPFMRPWFCLSHFFFAFACEAEYMLGSKLEKLAAKVEEGLKRRVRYQ